MKTETLKLSDRGTSGLLQWIAAGEKPGTPLRNFHGLRAARIARAAAIIHKRYGAEAETVFRKVARREAAARDAVARLKDGGAIICRRTLEESAAACMSVEHLCKLAGRSRDHAAAITEARNRATDETAPSYDRTLCREFLMVD